MLGMDFITIQQKRNIFYFTCTDFVCQRVIMCKNMGEKSVLFDMDTALTICESFSMIYADFYGNFPLSPQYTYRSIFSVWFR